MSWLGAQVGASPEPVFRVLHWMETHGAVRLQQEPVVDIMRLKHRDLPVLLSSPVAGIEPISVWQQSLMTQAVG